MLRSTGFLVLFSLLSQALALALQVALAHRFGAGPEVDAYVAALTLPGLVEAFVLAGVTQLLLPALVQRLDRGEAESAWRALATLVTLLGGGLLLLAIPVALAREAIVAALAPGLSGPARALAGDYLALLFPGLAAGVAGALLTQAFHARRRFALPAAAGAAAQALPLLAVIAFGGRWGLWSLIAGTLAAKLAVLAPLLAVLRRAGVPLRPRLDLAHPDVRRVAWLALPAMAAVASARLNGAVDRFFVSFLGPGKLAAFGYADRVVALVLAVLVSPATSVLYPSLAGFEARGDRAGLFRAIDRGVRAVIAGMLPVAIAMALLAGPAMRALFEHGRFAAADTERVAGILACYGGILWLAGVGSLLVRGFYAVGNARDPLIWGGLVPVALNAGMNALVFRRFDVYGVAAVTSLNAIVGLPVLYAVLRRRLGAPRVAGWPAFLLRAACAGGAMAAAMRLVVSSGAADPGIALVCASAAAGLLAYAAAALLLRLDPAALLAARVRTALRARKLLPAPEVSRAVGARAGLDARSGTKRAEASR
jgi:putative peptidoglycan lipid II flippase